MSNAIAAKGTLLQRGDGASPTENFTTIAEVTNLSGPSLSSEPLDVTHHGSPSGWREFIGGLKDGGEITAEANYIPADPTQDGATGVLKALKAQSIDNYKLIFPDSANTEFLFAALVTGFEPSAPVDGKLAKSTTFKITGSPTLN